MSRMFLMGLVFVLVAGACPSAFAFDVWTVLHPGIQHLHRAEGGQVIHMAEVDLQEEAVSIRVTREAEGWVVPSAIAQSLGSAVTINGDWASQGRPFGLSVGGGWQWTEAVDPPNPPGSPHDWLFLACTVEKECFFDAPGVQQSWQHIWHNVVGGNEAVLIADGAGLYPPGALYSVERHPRSAVCLDASGSLLMMFVVQGRRSDSLGMTFWETTDLLLSFGCHNAMMLDGGGSSGLVLDGVLANARPSNEPSERSVPNHFSILYTPEFDSECAGQPNSRTCSSTTLQLCQGGQVETVDCSFFGALCEEGEGTAYCVHPSCSNGGFGTSCLDESRLADCSYGQKNEVDCAAPFGLQCEEDELGAFCTDPRCTEGPNAAWCEKEVAKTCGEGAYSEVDCALGGFRCLEGECRTLEDDEDSSDDDDSSIGDDDDSAILAPPDTSASDDVTGCDCSLTAAQPGQDSLLLALGLVAFCRRKSACARRVSLWGGGTTRPSHRGGADV